MTSDGYEFYSYKSADEYDFNKAYVALDDITDVEKEEGKIRIYTKDGSVYDFRTDKRKLKGKHKILSCTVITNML